DQLGGTSRTDEKTRETSETTGIHREGSWRPQPVEHEAFHGVAATRSEVGGGGTVRSFHRWQIPTWHEVLALAAGQIAEGMHHGAGQARESVGFDSIMNGRRRITAEFAESTDRVVGNHSS